MSDDTQTKLFVFGVVTLGFWALFEQALPMWGIHTSLGAVMSSVIGLQ